MLADLEYNILRTAANIRQKVSGVFGWAWLSGACVRGYWLQPKRGNSLLFRLKQIWNSLWFVEYQFSFAYRKKKKLNKYMLDKIYFILKTQYDLFLFTFSQSENRFCRSTLMKSKLQDFTMKLLPIKVKLNL